MLNTKHKKGQSLSLTGQSTLEYVIIVTAIVAAIIAGVVTFGKKDSASGLGKLLNQSASNIEKASAKALNVVPTP